MFFSGRPSDGRIESFLAEQSALSFSYPEVGATRGESARGVPAGYTVDSYRVRLGRGDEVFERARTALVRWRMFDLGWAELLPKRVPVERGSTVAVLARHLGFHSLNAARVVYVDGEEGRRHGFAYGTLPGHAARGEERFSVLCDRRDGSVYYEVLAFSRPRHPLSYAGYPITRLLQRRFARDSKAAMVAAVKDASI